MFIGDIIKGIVQPAIHEILDFIPNPKERERAKEALQASVESAVTTAVQMQLETNKVEAAHPSVFVAGARPFLMWIGGAGIGFNLLIHPLLVWVWAFAHIEGAPPPPADLSLVIPIVGLLIGARTYEKQQGVATKGFKAR